jgi:hypothetical protein
MPRIELTIKTDYMPNWGAWEGIRELIQNGKDAEVEYSAPLKIDWYNDTLRIENDGAVLPHEALLLGHTTKTGRSDLRGKFGEGLKLGTLALVRAGFPVKIRSGSEVWEPKIERSDKFNADVLVFNIVGGRKDDNRVRVEIGSIPREVWEKMKEKFLWLIKKEKNDRVETDAGTLLLSEKLKGRVFVKGIYVMHKEEYTYGYDLSEADLDRDRRIIDGWDLKYRTQRILSSAAAKRPDLLDPFFDLLESGKEDVAGVGSYSLPYMPTEVKEFVTKKFTDRYGDDAIPVKTLEESKDIEHLGKRGIVVPAGLASILAEKIGTMDTVKEKLRAEIVKKYGWHEMSEDERANLESAVNLVQTAAPDVTLGMVDVADFRSADLLGQHKEGRAIVAKKLLANRAKTLATLVHEVAHRNGIDGDKGHVAEIERIWSAIVERLRSQN